MEINALGESSKLPEIKAYDKAHPQNDIAEDIKPSFQKTLLKHKANNTISQIKSGNEFQDKAAQRTIVREHSFDPQNSLGSFSNGKWYNLKPAGTDIAYKEIARKFEMAITGALLNIALSNEEEEPAGGMAEKLFSSQVNDAYLENSGSNELGDIGQNTYDELKRSERKNVRDEN